MATVKVDCDDCGTVSTTIDEVTVRTCSSDGRAAFVLRCPQCTMPIARPVSGEPLELLVEAGARVERWQLPLELFEPRHGEPFTVGDLATFGDVLARPGWFDDLLSTIDDR